MAVAGVPIKIAAQNLTVLTQLDAGAAITLTNADNAVPGNVTLSALNTAGTARAAGAIDFVDGTRIRQSPGRPGAGVTFQAGGALQQPNPIVAQNLVVRTQLDAGAAITLTNSGNAVPGNVTLSALNTAGTASAPGAISLLTAQGFTLAGATTAAGLSLQAGGAIQQAGPATAQNLVARTQLDGGAAITLTNPGNTVPGNVTFSTLNGAGTVPAAGDIDFVDSTGFTVAAQRGNGLNGQEIGVNTTADVTMQAGGDFLLTGGGSSTLTVGGMVRLRCRGHRTRCRKGRHFDQRLDCWSRRCHIDEHRLGLFSTGPIIENATGTISVPYLLALNRERRRRSDNAHHGRKLSRCRHAEHIERARESGWSNRGAW